MTLMDGLESRLARFAARRNNVFTRDEALSLGYSEDMINRRVAAGTFVRLFSKVYSVPGEPLGLEGRAYAVCLHAGSRAVASHRTAAALLDLDAVPHDVVELSIRSRLRIPGVVVHQTDVERHDRAVVGAIPITRPVRTLVDLGGVLDPDSVEAALESALRKRLCTIEQLERYLVMHSRRGRNGAGVARRFLTRRPLGAPPTESILETRFLQLLRKARLPQPIRQFTVARGRRHIRRVDFAYPDRSIAIELQSRSFHAGEDDWRRDMQWVSELGALGWSVLLFTWDDVHRRPDRTLGRVRLARSTRNSGCHRR